MSRPAWDNYFMSFAHAASTRGTCDRKHVGAVIVIEKQVVATGYNGSVRGMAHCDDVGHDIVSGHCVTGDTVISKHQAGNCNSGHKTAAEIHAAWIDGGYNNTTRGALKRMKIRSMTPSGLIRAGHISDVWASDGEQAVVKVTTSLGRTVKTTPEHRFFTPDGWFPIQALSPGDQVGLNGHAAENDLVWLAGRYNGGTTIQQLAKVIGRSRTFVKQRLLKDGVSLRTYRGGWNKGLRRGARYGGRDVLKHSAHERARRYALGKDCRVCGSDKSLQVHHLDEDAFNDAEDNLDCLCLECHNIAHTPHAKVKIVKFDRLVSVEPAGRELVYDLTVPGRENFIGNGFVLHNCVRTIHAEMNALAQAARRGVAVDRSTIYTTASPCWDCFRVLVNAGIQRFVYAEGYRAGEHQKRIQEVATQLGIEVAQVADA